MKWYNHVLSNDELKMFIKNARNGKSGNALIGIVSVTTKKIIKEKTGIDVTKIILEGSSVIHIDNPKHKLEQDDVEKCVDVINNPVNITLSPERSKQGLNVLIFEGNINGKIFFVEVVHKKYLGFLTLKTAYRQNKQKKLR